MFYYMFQLYFEVTSSGTLNALKQINFLSFPSERCSPPKKLLKTMPDWACSVWRRSVTWWTACVFVWRRVLVLFWKKISDLCIFLATIQACEGKRRVLFVGISCGLSVSRSNRSQSELFKKLWTLIPGCTGSICGRSAGLLPAAPWSLHSCPGRL